MRTTDQDGTVRTLDSTQVYNPAAAMVVEAKRPGGSGGGGLGLGPVVAGAVVAGAIAGVAVVVVRRRGGGGRSGGSGTAAAPPRAAIAPSPTRPDPAVAADPQAGPRGVGRASIRVLTWFGRTRVPA